MTFDRIRAFRDATKENVDYIAGILGILYSIIDITSQLYFRFNRFSIYLKVIGGLFVGLLILIFFKNLRKIIQNILYSLRVEENLHYGEREVHSFAAKKTIDFQRIIPSTKVLEELYARSSLQAQRNLHSECFLTLCELHINFQRGKEKPNSKNFEISTRFDFFSQRKKMSAIIPALNLKLLKENIELCYEDAGVRVDPFFKNQHWRKAVIEACERTEVHLLTRDSFSINLIGYALYDIYILFLRENNLSKNYTFAFLHNKLYEGSASGQLIKDYN